MCVLVKDGKDKYYVRFHNPSEHSYRETLKYFTSQRKILTVNGAWNVCQGYRVNVRACRACQGQLLCKVHNPSHHRYWEINCDSLTDGRNEGWNDGQKFKLLYRTLLWAGGIKSSWTGSNSFYPVFNLEAPLAPLLMEWFLAKARVSHL